MYTEIRSLGGNERRDLAVLVRDEESFLRDNQAKRGMVGRYGL